MAGKVFISYWRDDANKGTKRIRVSCHLIIWILAIAAMNSPKEAVAQTIASVSPLPSATEGKPYSYVLMAAGGRAPYIWSLGGGMLPVGLSLSSNGLLSGTPRAVGTFTFTARVQASSTVLARPRIPMSANVVVTKTITLSVRAAPSEPVSIVTVSLSHATQGELYWKTLQSIGGKAPYAWSIASGALPVGLALSPAGQLVGKPAALGSFTFTVSVVDSTTGMPRRAKKNVTLIVLPPHALSITTDSPLPIATKGQPYTQPLEVRGGTTPYRWSKIEGIIPDGLGVSSSDGLLSGRPTVTGRFSFTLMLTDARGATTKRVFELTVK